MHVQIPFLFLQMRHDLSQNKNTAICGGKGFLCGLLKGDTCDFIVSL